MVAPYLINQYHRFYTNVLLNTRTRAGRSAVRTLMMATVLCMASLGAFAQTSSQCTTAGTTPVVVASTGLAEKVGNVVLTCTGGNSGSTVIGQVYVTLNTNITNSLDVNGNPQFITFSGSGAAVTASSAILSSATTLEFTNINYTVPTPNTIPVTITIGGIRAAVASIQSSGGTPAQVSASVFGIGVTISGAQVNVGYGTVPLLSSAQLNALRCNGSPLPATTDFPSFIAAGTSSSAVRVTEGYPGAFAPQDPTATNGTRIIVQFSGYAPGSQLFVPNVLVGTSGTIPTTAGEFGTTIASGTYTPLANQLLLTLVTGTDANGAGGTLAISLPTSSTSSTAMTQLALSSSGAALAVYEVLDHNAYVNETVQIPVFVANPAFNCAAQQETLAAMEAPVSTVAVASATAPVPRYVAAALGSDCLQIGDCNGAYFPVLSVNSTPISLTGASLGGTQTGSISVLNNGGSLFSYTTSITYQSGSGWLTVTPSTGDDAINATLSVVANPAALQPGTYTALVNINGGEAGTASVPVTFTVGPAGVTIQAIVNAASLQAGAVAPGSYVALYGLNLAGANVGATFNSQTASVIYDSAGQINLIVPASLSGQTSAAVVVTVNGQVSNTFTVALTANEPGIFTPGILNSDSSVNATANPATRGTFVQVYLTGLAVPVTAGSVTVNMGGQTGIVPLYAGAQGTLPALDQINVTVPASLAFTGNSTPLTVCVALSGSQQICSNTVSLYVQ
jgi:uncharacterized protein (TIGR03437 family)